ncbi:MAG TPA: methyltransferase [Myxococcota bacterium]|nr:methyltransferase [Myxococcota bacterium]
MLAERQAEAIAFLEQRRGRWVNNAFLGEEMLWREEAPELHQRLCSLSFDEVEAGERGELELPEPFPTWRRRARIRLPRLATVELPSRGWNRAIKGRKWAQVEAFARVVLGNLPTDGSLVEWCSGKGHLGRNLCIWSGRPARCIEIDPALCAAGRRRLRDEPVTFVTADVTEPSTAEHLHPGDSVLALHACGELLAALLPASDELGFLAAAPCCYHRTEQPFLGSQTMELDDQHVRLATVGETCAGVATQRVRRREHAWRAALDLLVREATGEDRYHPTRPCKQSDITQRSFEEFVRWIADDRGLPLPEFDPERAERAGWERARVIRALGLVRAIYGRRLEHVLCTDRALYLEERGWSVEIGTFCGREVTPRNLAFVARPERARGRPRPVDRRPPPGA